MGDSVHESSSKDAESLKLMELNANKAGMQGLDTQRINQIIEEASKGSKFYQHKLKSQERINTKIEEMKLACSKLTEEQKKAARHKMDQLAARLEKERDLTRTMVHVDMDAFYAAVEMRDTPELKDKPMAVGSSAMLSTSNYHARRFGVRAAMPGFIAKKLCPELIIVPTNFPKYTAVSRQVQSVFADYDPEFSAASLDEAYLDLTEYLGARPDMTPSRAVEEMRAKIYETTQLTASAGIAPNGMLAKVCSDRNKPNGQFQLESTREAVMDFVRPLPIRKISGIGNVTEQLLGSLGVATCGDLWEKRDLLCLLFSECSYDYFLRVALGIGSSWSSDGSDRSERKSMSCETTFRPSADREELCSIIRQLSEELSQDLRRHNTSGRGVTLKYKTDSFDTKTRIVQLHEATQDGAIIASAALKLLPTELPKLRLLGVRMSQLVNRDGNKGAVRKQRTVEELLASHPPGKRRKLEEGSSSAPSPEGETGTGTTLFTCPVCQVWRTDDGEIELNRHVDECLNQQVLSEHHHGQLPPPGGRRPAGGQTRIDRFLVRQEHQQMKK